ncbi:signal recognition particle-docking protein FtsY [Saccharomonospora sp. CUA-673]|uniref:signal recognition particle-docking protein FtsY n=1 Tax=Saccharomonospora sp. CUA-673 TaxID=1904969 RepID=UPI00095BE2E5|nr:signal recognition particle-docking protein FtsY [Saccharomonospora sp. CUA-673]OLT47805.1 signal recognition particle-docking protein FtsY [Saccharomonospora sp. CUA-673]
MADVSNEAVIWIVVVVAAVLAVALVAGLILSRKRKISLERDKEKEVPKGGGYQAGGGISLAPGGTAADAPESSEPAEPAAEPKESPAHPVEERTEVDGQPGVGDDASVPRDAPRRDIVDVGLPDTEDQPADTAAPEKTEPEKTPEPAPEPEPEPAPEPAAAPAVEEPEPAAGRIERLRGRLSKSRSALGQGLLGLLGAGDLDEDSWEEIEDTLLVADLGAATTTEIVEKLRGELSTRGVRTAEEAREALHSVLTQTLWPDADRSVHALPHTVDGEKQPAVVLIAGVNGTGKTTTTGKLARVLVAQGRQVLLGAADTFRAAAADQLETWSQRVGAEVVRGKEGADPASVAFDSVKRGVDAGVDAVLVDTAGRLHTKTGLMDELGKVKRVVEKQAKVDEVLLVLDATTGQNGLAQARVFSEVVDVTGVVLTKLDGTAKGGIVFQVQRELGVPVKLVGLGEGPDDLAPFEPSAFVDALLD